MRLLFRLCLGWGLTGWLACACATATGADVATTLRALSAKDPHALILQWRNQLDSGRFATDPAGEREVLWWMGHAAVNASDDVTLTEATARLDSLGSTHKDELALAYAGFLRADHKIERGDPSGVSDALRAAEHLQGNPDPAIRALTQFQLCDVYTMAEDYEHALPLCRSAETAYQSIGDEWNLAQAENNEASVLFSQDHNVEAARIYEQAQSRYVKVGDHSQAVMVGDNLARVYLKMGRARDALALSRASLADEREGGRLSDALLSRANIARALNALGETQQSMAEIAGAVTEARLAQKNGLLPDLLQIQSDLAESAGNLKLALAAQRELIAAREAQRAPGIRAEEAELNARYAAREKELRIRDLERDNQMKDLELKTNRIDAERRDDAAWYQRLGLFVIGAMALGLALIVVLLWLLLRVQRRHAAVLGEQALRDPLTGVENRRGFFLRLHALLATEYVMGSPLHALLLIDLDHFKRVNDDGGHPFGDLVLNAIADCMRRVLGRHGELARLGGEEFAALCPRLGGEAALRVAENLRAEVAKLCFPLAETEMRVTISIGLALFDGQRNHDTDSWLRSADKALYTAKSHGRDRVVASAALR